MHPSRLGIRFGKFLCFVVYSTQNRCCKIETFNNSAAQLAKTRGMRRCVVKRGRFGVRSVLERRARERSGAAGRWWRAGGVGVTDFPVRGCVD